MGLSVTPVEPERLPGPPGAATTLLVHVDGIGESGNHTAGKRPATLTQGGPIMNATTITPAPANAHPILRAMAASADTLGAAHVNDDAVNTVIATFAGTDTTPTDDAAFIRVAAAMTRVYVDTVTERGAEWARRRGVIAIEDTITDADTQIARDVLTGCDTYTREPSVQNLAALAALPDGLHPSEGFPVSVVNALTLNITRLADVLARDDRGTAGEIVADDMLTVAVDAVDPQTLLAVARGALTR